eukprot:tig00000248_g21783.t1
MDGGGLSALERLPDALLHRVAAELGPLQAVEVAMLHCVSRRLREAARGAEYALLDLSRGFFAFGGVGVAREAALRRVARRAAFGWYRGVRGVRLRYGSRVEAEVASELLGALHACPLERAEIESDAPLASGDEEDELEDEEDEGEEEEELGGGGGEEDEERKQRPAGRRRGPPSRSLDLLQALAPFSTLEVVEASLEVMWDPRPFSWAALPRLRALRLPRRLLRDSEVSALVSALPGLRRLAICAVGGAALQHLTRLPLLEAVEVEPLDGDCAAVLALLRGPARARLRRLAVPFGRVPPALLEEVASLPLLESLVIALEEESAAGVPVLGQAARLASLDARVVLAGSGASAGLLRALGDAAGAAPALRTLDLTSSRALTVRPLAPRAPSSAGASSKA